MKEIIKYFLCVLILLSAEKLFSQINYNLRKVAAPHLQQQVIKRIVTPRPDRISQTRLVSKFSIRPFVSEQNKVVITRVSDISNVRINRVTPNKINNTMIPQPRFLPSVTKRMVDNSTVTYQLVSSDNTKSWLGAPELKKNVVSQTSDGYDNANQMDCHTTVLNFNAQSTSFMNAQPMSQGAYLMPGMIYSFEDISDGNLTQQRYNVDRNPISLYSNVVPGLSGSSRINIDVANPNSSTLSQGIANLRSQFGNATGGGSDIQVQITQTENDAEQAMAIAGGGSYLGFSGQAAYNQSSSSYHLYYTLDAVKSLFTINALPDSGSLYKPDASISSSGQFPVMINNVTYGSRVLANVDIQINSSANATNLQFQYNGGFASAWAGFEQSLQNKNVTVTINGYLIGFPQKFSGSFSADLTTFENMMNTFFNGCDYNSAEPIQYVMTDLSGNMMGISSITDNAKIQECVPADQTYTLQSVYVNFKTGPDDKNSDSEFWLSIATGDQSNPKWVSRIYDNHSSFSQQGNPYQLAFPNVPPVPYDDFEKKGGLIALKLISHDAKSDDWNFNGMTFTFNFISNHGLTITKTLMLGAFSIHDTDAGHDSKDILFESSGDQNSYMTR